MSPKQKPVKSVKAWAGFVAGRLDGWAAADNYDAAGEVHLEYAIFRTRRDARKRYQDVRPVTITPTTKRARK